MIKKAFGFVLAHALLHMAMGQAVLQADGPGNTYEDINAVLAPGYNVIEVPDCGHSAFGRHIDEVYDSTLGAYVFRFFMHTHLDDDRCKNDDRQRNEIKTYDKSPDSLLAVEGEVVQYSWKFKLDSSFQPSSSFTHLHQIKAVGGPEDAMPSITLTARKGSPDQLELRYAAYFNQTTLTKTDLSPFLGHWLSVSEQIHFGEIGTGKYEVFITRTETGDTLFQYQNESIRIWKTDAEFLRPKWGIYRSLNDSTNLKDEEVYFADFRIEELDDPILSVFPYLVAELEGAIYLNPVNKQLMLAERASGWWDQLLLYNHQGQEVLRARLDAPAISLHHLPGGMYIVKVSGSRTPPASLKILLK